MNDAEPRMIGSIPGESHEKRQLAIVRLRRQAATLPPMLALRISVVAQDDTSPIDAELPGKLRQRLLDSVAELRAWEIDELRGDCGNDLLEAQARLQRAGVPSQANEQVAQIGHEKH